MYVDFDQLLKRIPAKARVLDLGGWERVFPRANVVVDLLPYETRKYIDKDIPEHFGKEDWIIADFCSPSFWEKIPDKSFDFVTIGHTLEDIRDPLYVCSQMIRCAHAGYIEAPSKIRELAKEKPSDVFSGYSHHRWLIEAMPDLTGLIFKAKLGWAHHGDYLGDGKRHLLNDYFHFFDGYFWKGSFKYIELYDKGPNLEAEDANWYFDNCINLTHERRNLLDLVPDQSSVDDGKCIWVDDYLLPSEYAKRHGHAPEHYPRYVNEPAKVRPIHRKKTGLSGLWRKISGARKSA